MQICSHTSNSNWNTLLRPTSSLISTQNTIKNFNNSNYPLNNVKCSLECLNSNVTNKNYDLESMIYTKPFNLQAAEFRITQVISIKHMLDLVDRLFHAMGDMNSVLLKTYKEVRLIIL